MKILLAVDGSAYTKKMLAYLTTHLEVFNANNEFTLFTVQMPLPPRARAAVGAEVANSYYAEEAEKVTAPVVKFLKRHGIEPKVVHKTGSPGEQIAKQANAGDYDLVMMGSHGHSALGNLVMGSVATQVLAHCGVPVLLVR
jgi:nucleotide-binding universal stress UspA family protein